jgi:phosphoribosylaminoimidazole-succinocarboxamide synthase
MSLQIPILIDNIEYVELAKKIESIFYEKHGYINLVFNIRLCVIEKSRERVFDIIDYFNKDDNVLCFFVISDFNSILERIVCSNTNKIVLTTKSLNENQLEIPLITKIVEGVAPLYVFGVENCVLAILKLINMLNVEDVDYSIFSYQQDIKNKDKILDIFIKYDNLEKYCLDEDLSFNYSSFEFIKNGKVRDLYKIDEEHLLFHTSNRLSAFDRNICEIPYKGQVLNRISSWWFNKTKDLVPNHLISLDGNNNMKVKKCKPILIEFVVRGYITGESKTSMWKNYNDGERKYCGHTLPEGLIKNQVLNVPLVTPTTKGKKDELISSEEIIKREILTEEQWNQCEKYALDLFNCGQMIADENGLILVDTKYEFGVDENDDIILIDELHTPDSSRYWLKHTYNLNSYQKPENIDKEIVRKWIKNNYDPYNRDIKIEVTDEMKNLLMKRYIQLYEILTNENFFDFI